MKKWLRLLAVVVGLAATGCKAFENDPIMGKNQFQPNMSLGQGRGE